MCGQYWSFQWTWHTTNPAQNQSGTWLNQHTTYPLHDRSGTLPIWHLTDPATNQSGTWLIRDTTYPPHYRSGTQPIWHLIHSATNLHTPDLVIDWSGARTIWCTTNPTHIRLTTNLAHNQLCAKPIHCIWHTNHLAHNQSASFLLCIPENSEEQLFEKYVLKLHNIGHSK